jgi:PKD repeat protein
MTLDAVTGEIIFGDVGGNDQSTAWEEVNLVLPRKNYGWPFCEGTCGGEAAAEDFPQCDCDLHTGPLFAYPHDTKYGPARKPRQASITGGFVYRRAGSPGGAHLFPGAFEGLYFYADYATWTIYVQDLGESADRHSRFELPVPEKVAFPFELPRAGGPIALTQGPDGSVWYSTQYGKIRRIMHAGDSNMPPVISAATASTTTGPAPLTVEFTGVAADPDGEDSALEVGWLFKRTEEVVPGAVLTRTFETEGVYEVSFVVDDGQHTVRSTVTVVVGEPPAAIILSPANGMLFSADDTILMTAAPAAGVTHSWDLQLKHNQHFHPVFSEREGDAIDFHIERTGHTYLDDVRLFIVLTATNSAGLFSQASIEVLPHKASMAFASTPSGIPISVDGIPYVTPVSLETLVNFLHTVVLEPSMTQNNGASLLAFEQWADGSHSLVRQVTARSGGVAFAATYTARVQTIVRHYGLACGAPDQWTDSTGAVWMPDEPYLTSGKSKVFSIGMPGVYARIRYAGRKQTEMVYDLPLPSVGTYTIKLHFVEDYYQDCQNRLIAVLFNGVSAEPAVDPACEAGQLVPLVKPYTINAGRQSFITVTVRRGDDGRDNPTLAAIEVFQIFEAPADAKDPSPPTEPAPTRSPTSMPTTSSPTLTPSTPFPTGTTTPEPVTESEEEESTARSTATCGMLGWNFGYGNALVCGASKIDGQCRTAGSQAVANEICQSVGGRLCTVVELDNNAAASTGCSFDNRQIWTADTCDDGGVFTQMGRLKNKYAAPVCQTSRDSNAVRCCADALRVPVDECADIACDACPPKSVHVDDSSCCGNCVEPPPTLIPTPPPSALMAKGGVLLLNDPIQSTTPCDKLGWRLQQGETVCSTSKPFGVCAAKNMGFTTAEATCSSVGGRLCTLAEVERGVTKSLGCQVDKKQIWTSTACGTYKVFTQRGKHTGHEKRCTSTGGDGSTSNLRCCADVGQASSGRAGEAPAPAPSPSGVSSTASALMIGMATVGMVVGFLGVAYARRGKPAAHMRSSRSASTWSTTESTAFGTATMISSRLSSRISSEALTEFEGEEVSRAISVKRQPGEVPNGRNMHSEI